MIALLRYSETSKDDWDNLVKMARNSHFMFQRDYMDYHADRFKDHSLIILNEKGRPAALFPANADRETLSSHGGLSFGGLILADGMRTSEVLQMLRVILKYAADAGFKKLIYKPMPHIYHQRPSEEELYGLFLCGAKMVATFVSTTINPAFSGKIQPGRIWGARRSERAGVSVVETDAFDEFFRELRGSLLERHGVAPVHTSSEMVRLKEKFPDQIRLLAAYHEGAMIAGVLFYETDTVCHAQYSMATGIGQKMQALSPLYFSAIEQAKKKNKFFDFGHSNKDNGHVFNETLCRFKERFGGSATIQVVYEVEL